MATPLSDTPGVAPVRIETRWFHAYRDNSDDDFMDYEYDLIFADGSVRTQHFIPNDWIPLCAPKAKAAAREQARVSEVLSSRRVA